jgi:hypothetical protein
MPTLKSENRRGHIIKKPPDGVLWYASRRLNRACEWFNPTQRLLQPAGSSYLLYSFE